ncbi:MAG TPA: carbohydrate kinase family protein [Terracidiphilus sp.]|jgi:sugar/nucleoside kinase (ribokinase family)
MTPPNSTRNNGSTRFDVTLVGDTNLDLLLYGLPEELPSERELLANDLAIRVGGSGAITAHNLSALGDRVGFITTASGDEFGTLCLAELRQAGVDLSRCVPVSNVRTGVTVHLQHQELRHMFTYAGATFQLALDHLDMDYLADARHFHMSSYYLQRALTPHIPELFAKLKSSGLSISLDPNDDPAQTWDRGILDSLDIVDVLMPNEREACLIAGEADPERAIGMLRDRVPLLVIKRGPRGASAYTKHDEWHVAGQTTKMVDAVGAGDSFNAGFLHGWIKGWHIERALAFGNCAGALSTKKSGGTAAFRDRESIEALTSALRA